MKLILPVLMLLSCGLSAQPSPFVDSIVDLVATHQISVYNLDLQRIDNDSVHLFQRDTVINDIWTRPEFRNLQYQDGFDGILVTSPIWFDTLTLPELPDHLVFLYEDYQPDGGSGEVFVSFLTAKTSTTNYILHNSPVSLITNGGRPWKISHLDLTEAPFLLDSCLTTYRLFINKDLTFTHYFGTEGNISCSTSAMEVDKTVGIEGPLADGKYLHRLRGHFLDEPSGRWRIIKGRLYFFDQSSSRKLISYELVSCRADELILRTGTTTIKFVK